MEPLTSNANNWQPELVKEYSRFISKRYTVRLYRAKGTTYSGIRYRWFFGFPEEMVPDALQFLLNTTPYWGEEPAFKDGNFYLWWLPICTEESEPPFDRLNNILKLYSRRYNMALKLCAKWAGQAEKAEKGKS
jgi:hypothetical protein